ncbi:MAG: carbohydrate-binding domain-containing protein [Oscillospiraceae bacterium]|nr:carbohydrate-binding domain-containing protein [Oscillospiraceae bacterium]MCR5305988.1 carbohydrate-binding domain-containing protein [Oscillospiraceae bacterium]
MKHRLSGVRRISALLTAFLLAGTLAACGQKNSSNTAPDTSGSTAADQTGEAPDSTGENPSQGGEDNPSGGDSTDGGEQKGGEDDPSGGEDDPSGGGEDKPAKTEAQPGGNGGSSKTTAKNGSGSSTKTTAKTGSGGSGGGNTSSTAKDDDPDLDPTDEEKPTKYINLTGSSARFSGDGIAVSGSKITISKGGHYEISGTLDNGQIYIETDKKKVKLMLNNCSITNKSGAAIYCQQAKKVTLESLPGTTSTISDGGTHDEDKGAVFSEDTVVLKGEGTINIKGVYAHGVKSDDDIRVNGGTVNITATKSCLYANDAIEINGGTLFCDGGTNGIKTSKPESMITVNGGSSIMIGGERDEKGAISSAGTFTVTGGSLWAIGNSSTLPDAATTANMLILTFSNSQAANSAVQVTSGSSPIFAMTSPHPYKYVFYAGTNLQSNATYSVRYGGSLSGAKNYVTNGSGYSGGSDGGSFKADRKVATHNIS